MSNPKQDWPRGSMKFIHKQAKPKNISWKVWPISDKYRVWVSKPNETPSKFIARILHDLEKDGAQIYPYLKKEMEP